MKGKITFRILGALSLWIMSLATTTAQADFYTEYNYLLVQTNKEEQGFLLTDIRKLTFSDQALTIFFRNDKSVSVLFSELSYLSFGEMPSAIEELPVDQTLSATYRPAEQCVVVNANAPILSVCIYNMQGNLVQQLTPHTTEAILSLDQAPNGIYIVVASTGEDTCSQKFVKH